MLNATEKCAGFILHFPQQLQLLEARRKIAICRQIENYVAFITQLLSFAYAHLSEVFFKLIFSGFKAKK